MTSILVAPNVPKWHMNNKIRSTLQRPDDGSNVVTEHDRLRTSHRFGTKPQRGSVTSFSNFVKHLELQELGEFIELRRSQKSHHFEVSVSAVSLVQGMSPQPGCAWLVCLLDTQSAGTKEQFID